MQCKYVIELIYTNGSKEIIDNSYTYKEAIVKYKEIRDNNRFAQINFIQINNSLRKNLFTKKSNVNNTCKSVFDLLENLNDVLQDLQHKQQQIRDQVALIDKRKSVFEHKQIEALDVENVSLEDKARLFDEFRRLIMIRRELKNELANLQSTKPELDTIIATNKKLNEKTQKYIEKIKQATESIINDEIPEYLDKQIIHEYDYKDHKERIKLTKELLKKYDRVIHDEMVKKLICYNKSKSAM